MLHRLDAPDVQADGGVEFQGPAAGCCLRIAEHNAHLFTQLVNEDGDNLGFVDGAGQLPQGLGHKPGLQAYVGIPHLAFDFRLRHKSRYGVHNNDINGAAAYQGFRNLQRLLAGIRLGQEELVYVDAKLAGIQRIQSMLRIDECGLSACLLHLCDGMQCNCCFTGGFRSVYFNNPPTRKSAYAKGNIQSQRTAGDGLHLHVGRFSKLHNRAFAELLFDIAKCRFQCCATICQETHFPLIRMIIL
ncbi:hypothetical protein D3C75_809450 [compost metagenome]